MPLSDWEAGADRDEAGASKPKLEQGLAVGTASDERCQEMPLVLVVGCRWSLATGWMGVQATESSIFEPQRGRSIATIAPLDVSLSRPHDSARRTIVSRSCHDDRPLPVPMLGARIIALRGGAKNRGHLLLVLSK